MKNISFIQSMSKYPIFILLLFCFFACSNKCSSGNEKLRDKQNTKLMQDSVDKKLVMVPIPENLTSTQDKADYLVLHYWDNFNFADTTYIHQPNVINPFLLAYVNILSTVDKDKAVNSIKATLSKAEDSKRMRTFFIDSYKNILYDPNSPLRNEELYIPVVEYIIKSTTTSQSDLERAKYDLNLLLKNRLGDKATDFVYTLVSGNTGTLYEIKGSYTILMFYNPDCHACDEVLTYMKESPIVDKALQNKLLSILAFYPDKDITIWRKHFSDIPSTWINGYDKEQIVEKKQLYDLKAIPTLYLLDKSKKVLLKDASIDTIVSYIRDHNLFLLAN